MVLPTPLGEDERMSIDMKTTTGEPARQPVLGPATRLGAVHLTVTDLERSISFYERSIGLRRGDRTERSAALSAGGDDLLVLTEEPAARRAGHHAGLYHVAILHPSRLELARAVLRLVGTETSIDGASDHGISEAIYLSDPDGNGLELAADRPRETWPDLSDLSIFGAGPQPLDLNGLVALARGEEPRPHVDPATRVGHMHLHVGDIAAAAGFYRDVLGFEVQTAMPSAMFVSAGGYHHHVAFNTWRGPGVAPQPPGTVGLGYWTLLIETLEEYSSVVARLSAAGIALEREGDGVLLSDPSGIGILIRQDE